MKEEVKKGIEEVLRKCGAKEIKISDTAITVDSDISVSAFNEITEAIKALGIEIERFGVGKENVTIVLKTVEDTTENAAEIEDPSPYTRMTAQNIIDAVKV